LRFSRGSEPGGIAPSRGRYGDVELRVLEYFVRNPDLALVFLPGDFDVLLMRLLDAGLLEKEFQADGSIVVGLSADDLEPSPDNSYTVRQTYRLTDEGVAAVSALREARSIHDLAE
jgi:hypothetical protein